MRRRTVLALIGATTPPWFRAALAQPVAMPVVGILGSGTSEMWKDRLAAFRQGLGETGLVEGRNVAFEYRWAHGRYDRLPQLATELVGRGVNVIVVLGTTASALAARHATASIPIVARIGVNPVQAGLVASLNRPGGNITGVTTLGVEVGPKQLELLRELVPGARIMGLLVDSTNPVVADMIAQNMVPAARAMGLELHVLRASSDAELEAAFLTLKSLPASALVIGAAFNHLHDRLVELTMRHGLPAVSAYEEFAAVGELMSYGGSVNDSSRLVGVYTGRILKGEKPGDLPFQQSAKIDLVINLATAKALGITVPTSMLTRANEVIE